ncbi:hypothetical protein DFH09DRAFT_1376599, partial [Mycena vulgaris]
GLATPCRLLGLAVARTCNAPRLRSALSVSRASEDRHNNGSFSSTVRARPDGPQARRAAPLRAGISVIGPDVRSQCHFTVPGTRAPPKRPSPQQSDHQRIPPPSSSTAAGALHHALTPSCAETRVHGQN